MNDSKTEYGYLLDFLCVWIILYKRLLINILEEIQEEIYYD